MAGARSIWIVPIRKQREVLDVMDLKHPLLTTAFVASLGAYTTFKVRDCSKFTIWRDMWLWLNCSKYTEKSNVSGTPQTKELLKQI